MLLCFVFTLVWVKSAKSVFYFCIWVFLLLHGFNWLYNLQKFLLKTSKADFNPQYYFLFLCCLSLSDLCVSRKLPGTIMGKLPTQSGGIMTTLTNISGQLIKFATIFCFCGIFCCLVTLFERCRTPGCFDLGWPMKKDSSFLRKPPRKGRRVGFDYGFFLYIHIQFYGDY